MDVVPPQAVSVGVGWGLGGDWARVCPTGLPGGTRKLEEGECSITLTRTGEMRKVKLSRWLPPSLC